MKLSHIAIAACAAISGQAFALGAVATNAIPAAQRLTISGSSALRSVIEGLLNQPGNCVPGTFNRYSGLLGSPAAGGSDVKNGQSQNLYSCTLLAGSDFGVTFDNKDVVIIKREAGGSINGVFPLLTGAAQIQLIDPTSCTDVAPNAFTCNSTVATTPQAGVSDLEPVAFTLPANNASPASLPGAPFRSSTSVAEQIFALIVNDNLFNDLVAAQGVNPPTVTSSAFASMFASGYDAATLGWLPFGKTLPGATNQVNVCSRGIGSGTRATAQIQFLQLPYNAAAPAVATPADSTAGDVKGGNIANSQFHSEESSSGNVVSCVGLANAGGGYSIGIVGADIDLTNTGTHFVNLDNQVPGKATAKEGMYPWVFESFYQVNKNNVASTSLTLLPNAFGNAFKKPININAVTVPANNGVMATPANCSGAKATDWVLPEEVASCSRVSRSKDSRLPLQFVK